jgi:rubredoxin
MDGVKSAWNLMKKYSKKDTILLYDVYEKIKPWITSGVNMGMLVSEGDEAVCPACGSDQLQKRGFATTNSGKYQRYQCKNCGKYPRARNKIKGSGNPLTH